MIILPAASGVIIGGSILKLVTYNEMYLSDYILSDLTIHSIFVIIFAHVKFQLQVYNRALGPPP